MPPTCCSWPNRIAREAGSYTSPPRRGVRIAATKSALADIVTEADREVETLIRARLAAARLGDGFLGEESGAERGSTQITWVVDPIDGTVNYAYGIPHYAVSIARSPATLIPSCGRRRPASSSPVTGDPSARRGGAAPGSAPTASRCRGRRMPGRSSRPDSATTRPPTPETRARAHRHAARPRPASRGRRVARPRVRRGGVYRRLLNAAWHRGSRRRCAPIEEAGGVVGGALGGRPGRQMTIAAGPDLYAALDTAIYH